MKLAFVTTYDPQDVLSWSGLPASIWRYFQEAGIECEWVKPARDLRVQLTEHYFRMRDVVGRRLSREGGIDFLREPGIQKAYCADVNKQIKTMNPDIVFSTSSLPVAYVECRQPLCFWTDATFGGMIDFYPEFTNLPARAIKGGWKVEDAALRHCTFSIYACDWAAKSAIDLHKANPATTKVVPFGANVETPEWERVSQCIRARAKDRCQLFFLGTVWRRKGGDVAYEVAKELNRRGVPTELHLVGCEPEIEGEIPPWVVRHGYASKRTAEGRTLIQSLLQQSHFLIIPSRAECVGIASAEASAYGLPSLVRRVGGMQSTVRDGMNGMTFDAGGSPAQIADYICATLADRQGYEALAEASYREFVMRMNWPVNVARVKKLFEEPL